MNITKFVPKALTRTAGKTSLQLQKQAPNIMFAAGLVGTVASTVLACRATLKLERVLDEAKEDVERVKEEMKGTPEYRRDLAYTYFRSAEMIIKPYLPAVAVGVVSIGLLTKSHNMLNQRNAALMAAYSALEKGFNEYRSRVRDAIGEDAERDLFYGATEEEVVVDGKKLKITKFDPNMPSPYARFFDESSANWVKDPEMNRLFIECQQRYFNQLLKVRGNVFLNEVYDALGMERSSIGSIVGWTIYNTGDEYIDFGMYLPRNRDFVNGLERSILLDFNVHGVIFDQIG